MVDSKTASAMVSVMVGFGCMASVFWGRVGTGDTGPRPSHVESAAARTELPASVPRAEAHPVAAASVATEAGIDRSIATGAIGHDSALRKPNPLAYADGKTSGPPTLTGVEAVNYLTGNTLKREEPGKPARFTYFAARGVEGDGNERNFVASAWDRNRPDLCDVAADGTPNCRPLTITLDGQYEFPGAKLGTVSIGGATATLLKGNVAKFPDHVPFLDEPPERAAVASVKAAAAGPLALWAGFVGRLVSVESDDSLGADRRILYYAEDNRVLDVRPTAGNAAHQAAVAVTVGHWHASKTGICQTRTIGDAAQSCFKPEASGLDNLRLVPIGKGAKAQRLTVLTETSAPQTAGR